MTVYLDVVLLENLCMNYIILFATGYIMKLKMNHIRIIISSFLGGIYAVVAYMKILPIYSNFLVKILLSIGMVYLAFGAKNLKGILKQLIIFYLTSFAFGGCAFALLYFVKPENILMRNGVYVGTYPIKIALLGGLVGFIITYIAFKVVKSRLSKKDIIYDITIEIDKKQVQVKAMLDTGNMLKDPITQTPVIVVEKEKLYGILPNSLLDHLENMIGGERDNILNSPEEEEYLHKLRMIPFHSIGKQNGLMLGIKADKVEILQEENVINTNIIIGIFNQSLSKNHHYSALIGLDILERSETNESIANSKI